MMSTRIDTTSYWLREARFPRVPTLQADERADVLVVGAGIAGLTSAYLLASSGASVVVLERGDLGQVDSGHTSAHLTMVTDMRLAALVKHFGRDHASAVWDAGLAAIVQIDDIIRTEEISCDFAWIPGYLHQPVHASSDESASLGDEARLAGELGFDAQFEPRVPLVGKPGVRFDGQARFHPGKYMAGLARAVLCKGGRIYAHSAATEFVQTPRTAKANGWSVSSGYTVMATHTPLLGTRSVMDGTLGQTKLALYSTCVVAGRVPKGSAPDVLLWDTGDPYRYYRLQPGRDHDLVIYGGEDHKTGQAKDTEDAYRRLEASMRSLSPGVELIDRWSGQVIETHDGLPFIGEQAPAEFAGTGYAGNGMTFGTLTGMMAADRFGSRTNPWTDLFDVKRSVIRGGIWDYVKENADYPYYLVRDRVVGPQARSLRSIPAGEGRVIEYRDSPAAVYREESGSVVIRSAVCSHMGCLVTWNASDKTWDCPCHGSRFTANGDVLAGPAESPLPPVE